MRILYHYLFTNDLRISTLNESLGKAGKCFATNTVPSSTVDKSANNNMMTLGFYFNLTEDSNCTKVAASGDARTVVLNFIKKFQFPNMRTNAAFSASKSDGIILAPMRIIVKVLYMMNLTLDSSSAYLSKEEIKYYIFYNEKVAKKKHPDIQDLINDILEYRKSKVFSEHIDTNESNHEWKHEDRQIREMIKVLQWAGCVTEKEGVYVIDNDNLSQRNKADIFDIINCNIYWEDTTIDSYRKYMDLESSNACLDSDYTEFEITHEDSNGIIENDLNEYQRAAELLLEFVSESGFENPIASDYVENTRNEFMIRFAPEKLAALSDEELLEVIFYTDGDNTDSLCCYIEINKDCRKLFGGIAGGSAFKFGLFKKKETGQWTSGSPNSPIFLTEEEALQRGKNIRDALVMGAEIIRNSTLDSLEAYEKLHDDLREKVGTQFYDLAWFHKYFAIVCFDKLSCYHSTEWQNHILYSFGIKPSKKYYARSGQIAMIENYAGMYYIQFFMAHVERYGGIKTFYRIGTTSDGVSFLSEWIKRGVVGIGWNEIGSLKEYESGSSLSKDDISEKLSELYYIGDKKSTASRKAGEIIRFYDTDDNSILVAADGERLLGLVDELGEYFYDSSDTMAHMKPGKWHLVFKDEERLPNKTEGLQTSFVQIKDEDNLIYLYNKYYYADETTELPEDIENEDEGNRERFRKWMGKQIIPEGDSNSGQFYSEVTVSSYVQAVGSVNVILSGKEVCAFKCNDPTTIETEIQNAKGPRTSAALKKYVEFLKDPEAKKFMERLKNCLEILRKPRQNKKYPVDFIIYGAPGTGKTYSTAEYALAIIENRDVDLSPKTDEQRLNLMSEYNKHIQGGQIVFTTFHQSYGYEEFIQGLRPDTTSDKMSFDIIDGVFKRIADKALNDQDNNYVIIIDEINRANISKVFGELITLIEEDKRWGEINQLCATLQSGDVFAVPNNLYIVGTMNSADKSISLIDAALRRRFEFIEQKPQPNLIADSMLKKVLISLNTSLADELESSDLLIGHSYFMNKKVSDLTSILNNSIIPLLYEYFYDNKKKVAAVLTKAIENTGVTIVDDKMGRLSVKKAES